MFFSDKAVEQKCQRAAWFWLECLAHKRLNGHSRYADYQADWGRAKSAASRGYEQAKRAEYAQSLYNHARWNGLPALWRVQEIAGRIDRSVRTVWRLLKIDVQGRISSLKARLRGAERQWQDAKAAIKDKVDRVTRGRVTVGGSFKDVQIKDTQPRETTTCHKQDAAERAAQAEVKRKAIERESERLKAQRLETRHENAEQFEYRTPRCARKRLSAHEILALG